MEKIVVLNKDYVNGINKMLEEGWKVKMISAFSESIARAEGWGTERGHYGAYVVLTKEKETVIKADNHDSTGIDYGCINDKIFKYS